MPSRSLLRGFVALWGITGLVLFIASVSTVRVAASAATHADPHVAFLGAIEAGAAALFLLPRFMRVGAALLLATLAIAIAVHALLGQWRGDLIVYGAAVLFVAIHGPLTPAQWRAALAR
jgi:uncharacterized membrane protein YphA (DoxX/SURF4 family)